MERLAQRNARFAEALQKRVVREQAHAFHLCLCYEQPVERVVMTRRVRRAGKRLDRKDVPIANGELQEPGLVARFDEPFLGNGHVAPVEGVLDGNLPH